MQIESWLGALAQPDHSAIDGDLESLADRDYPFLSDSSVNNQIERLSGHLGSRHSNVRRLVIAYSLYIRQVDVILQSGPRAFCGAGCPTPPAGCCNHEHYVIMNITDLMSSQNSPAALHMAHMIGLLQKDESAHHRKGRTMRPGYCRLLAEDGCTLRLFKSPRCVHYMCEKLQRDMINQSNGAAQPLLSAMKHVESTTISSPADFLNNNVIHEGARLYADRLEPKAQNRKNARPHAGPGQGGNHQVGEVSNE
ncbi:MAG: hypothetical protein Q8O35_04220 [Humidesulfovibrio sp.]|uniref:hypothetical protein n=1 Tax=Humidesulfovibrio sp. TaxID=2910988 RepID=UPI002733AF7E|nr:hypothetical protein [Humidesulfovibrio sp.]MDP2847379.1 hypothetical protein [Humidesulfovibrio sp.]